jgi:hypothetical protein
MEELKFPEHLYGHKFNGKKFLEESFQYGYRRVNCWNKLYRKKFLETNNIKFIDKLLFEDVPFTFNCFFNASKVAVIDHAYYYYRQRPGSIMTSPKQRKDPSRIFIIKHILNLLKHHEYTNAVFDDYLIYMLWENSYGTNNWNLPLALRLLTRFKFSVRGLFRLILIMLRIPKVVKN